MAFVLPFFFSSLSLLFFQSSVISQEARMHSVENKMKTLKESDNNTKAVRDKLFGLLWLLYVYHNGQVLTIPS